MMSQRSTWLCSLLVGVLILSAAGSVEADFVVVGIDFPTTAEVIAADPDQGAFGQSTDTSLGQSFTVDSAFSAEAIVVEYENDTGENNTDHTLNVTIFEVADVQGTNMVQGTILYTNTFTFPASSPNAGSDTIATIILDTPLALAAGGYAIQFTGTTDPGWEWLRTTSNTGNDVYPGGKAYQEGTEKSSGTKDFVLALSSTAPTLPPPTNLVFTQTGPALTSSANGTDLGEFMTEPSPELPWAYTLVAGAGDADNGSFQVSGDRLLTSGSFAALGGSMLSFRVQTELGGSLQAAFQVEVKTDGDIDGLPDDWEETWAPGDLTILDGNGGADADGDGVTDLEEYMLLFENGWNMNPRSDDTDGDTLLDADELAGADQRPPTNPADADTDGDGLTDTVESNSGTFVDSSDTGTDPANADTDGDALEDDVEDATGTYVSPAAPGTHPLTPDSDGDGLTDGEEVDLAMATDPLDWDSDGDTAGDGLEIYLFSVPTDPGSTPSFGWPVNPPQTFAAYTNHLEVEGGTIISETFGEWIELERGEQLTLTFDIVGSTNNVNDDLDLRFGFGGVTDGDFMHVGYMNPSVDLGSPTGTTAVIRYRNDADNWGGNLDNVAVASTQQIPANGGITGTSTVNSLSFSLIRSDLGYTGVLVWDDILLEATMTPVQYWGHPVWDRFHIRLNQSSGAFDVTNIRVTYGLATPPYIRPIVLSDLEFGSGPSLSFSFPTDLGSSGYALQGTSDLTDPSPAAWTTLLPGIPAGGATSTESTVEVPGGDLGATHRVYRVVVP